jgi:hypothetical protein
MFWPLWSGISLSSTNLKIPWMVSTPSTTTKTRCRGVYDRLTALLSIFDTQPESTGCLGEGLDSVVKWWETHIRPWFDHRVYGWNPWWTWFELFDYMWIEWWTQLRLRSMGGFNRLWWGLRPELESWIWGIVGVFPGPSSKTALKRCRVGRSCGVQNRWTTFNRVEFWQ